MERASSYGDLPREEEMASNDVICVSKSVLNSRWIGAGLGSREGGFWKDRRGFQVGALAGLELWDGVLLEAREGGGCDGLGLASRLLFFWKDFLGV